MTLSIAYLHHYAEFRVWLIVMLSVVMLNVVMLNVIMLSVGRYAGFRYAECRGAQYSSATCSQISSKTMTIFLIGTRAVLLLPLAAEFRTWARTRTRARPPASNRRVPNICGTIDQTCRKLRFIYTARFWSAFLRRVFEAHFWSAFLRRVFEAHFWGAFLRRVFEVRFWGTFLRRVFVSEYDLMKLNFVVINANITAKTKWRKK